MRDYRWIKRPNKPAVKGFRISVRASICEMRVDNGKLHGIAVKTPFLTEMQQQYGAPYIMQTWEYR
jgi:hypothetical protein